MVWGLLSQPARGRADQGRHRRAEVSRSRGGLHRDRRGHEQGCPVAGVPTFAGYVSSHPDVKLVVTDHGGLTATAETYLKAAGKKAGPDQHRRLRPLPRHHCGHQGRLDGTGHRPAGVAPGLPAHPPDLPSRRCTGSPACTSTPARASWTRATWTSLRRSRRRTSARRGTALTLTGRAAHAPPAPFVQEVTRWTTSSR